MKTLLTFFLLLASLTALAESPQAANIYPFATPQQQRQFDHIIRQLRCLVCQNQSLNDSNAKLAVDLRNQVYQMVKQGQSDQAILKFMVDRYGEFVLLKPAVNKATWVLWFGPFVMLFLVIMIVLMIIKKRQREPAITLTAAEAETAQRLIEEANK